MNNQLENAVSAYNRARQMEAMAESGWQRANRLAADLAVDDFVQYVIRTGGASRMVADLANGAGAGEVGG